MSVPMPARFCAYANVFACANVSACSHACTHAHAAHANAHVPIPNACVRADANTISNMCVHVSHCYVLCIVFFAFHHNIMVVSFC